MVARAGAGPVPVPYKELTADKLTECIKTALASTTLAKAQEMSAKMKGEDGVQNASESFQRSLNASTMTCFLLPDRVAVWRLRKTNVLLSSIAAGLLVRAGKLDPTRLKLYVFLILPSLEIELILLTALPTTQNPRKSRCSRLTSTIGCRRKSGS